MSSDKNLFEPPANKMLAVLPANDYERLIPHLKLVTLPLHQVIYEAAEPIRHIYFPDQAMVSIVNTMEDGSTVEVGIVSNEGMVGIPAILGDGITITTGFVQVSGTSLQIDADVVRAEFNRGGALQTLLLRYVQAVYAELAQGTACNRLHTLEERLARWLLTVSERLESEDFPLTQEFISQMLGVRRSGVTVAASTLSRAGMISYQRGHINILNREVLEITSCKCYGINRINTRQFARLLRK